LINISVAGHLEEIITTILHGMMGHLSSERIKNILLKLSIIHTAAAAVEASMTVHFIHVY
jgi:hypothetical protein